MDRVLCGADSAGMKYYFNEEAYGILPREVRRELKKLCVLYCCDAGGVITLGFSGDHRLLITVIGPIDEIGSELKVKQIQRDYEALFRQLEELDRRLEEQRQPQREGSGEKSAEESTDMASGTRGTKTGTEKT